MANFLDKAMVKRHHLVLDRDEVMNVLEYINRDRSEYEMAMQNLAVGNCGWAGDHNKWYIHFSVTLHRWDLIKDYLCSVCCEIDGLKIKQS